MVPLLQVQHQVRERSLGEDIKLILFLRLEDWYIALLQASSSKSDTKKVFSTGDMQALVDTIDTEPDPIPMRWLNAVLARVFFGLYRTEALEQARLPDGHDRLGTDQSSSSSSTRS